MSSLHFHLHEIFINSRGFLKVLSEKAGRNRDSLKIFEKWRCDFKCLAYIWSLGTLCCSAVHHDKQDHMSP